MLLFLAPAYAAKIAYLAGGEGLPELVHVEVGVLFCTDGGLGAVPNVTFGGGYAF